MTDEARRDCLLESMVAHELLSSLTTIGLSVVHIEQEVSCSADIRAELEVIRASVRRAASLARELRGSASRTEGCCTPRVVLRGAQSLFARRVGTAFHMERTVLSGPAPRVKLTEAALISVVLNLLANAADACAGRPDARVLLRLEEHYGATSRVDIVVDDNGCGIPLANQARIFDPGFTTKSLEGRGVGLHMVHILVTSAGGTITCASGEGRGSRLTLSLPALG